MKFSIKDPPLGRLVLAIFEHQQTYPNSRSFERNFGLEKATHILREFAAEASLQGEAEPRLPTAEQLRALIGDLRADDAAREGNVMYLAVLESLSGLTPSVALAVIARFYRLPFVITDPDLPPSAMS